MAISITPAPDLPSLSAPTVFNTKALALFAWIVNDLIPDLEGVTAGDIITTLDDDFIPTTDNAYDLGSAIKAFADLHSKGTANVNNLTVSGTVTGFQKGLKTGQVFASSGTYTPSAGVNLAIVELFGGGGGGGAGFSSGGEGSGGCGGNAGGYMRFIVDVSAIGTATVTIGAAGAGSASNGGAGGDTVWSDGTTTMTAAGGVGGDLGTSEAGYIFNIPNNAAANTAAGGANLVALLANMAGDLGDSGIVINGNSGVALGGGGGSGPLGGAGGRPAQRNSNGSTDGRSGTGYGSGGSGGVAMGIGAQGLGGAGAAGYCIITEFAT